MIKTLISIPESAANKLDRLAKKTHKSRGDLMRMAIEDWLNTQMTRDHEMHAKIRAETFGVVDVADRIDGVEFQRRVRSQW